MGCIQCDIDTYCEKFLEFLLLVCVFTRILFPAPHSQFEFLGKAYVRAQCFRKLNVDSFECDILMRSV